MVTITLYAAKSLQSCLTLCDPIATPWTVAQQASPWGFPGMDNWSGLPFPSPDNPVYETAKETLMYRPVFWTLWERERVG